MPDDFKHINVEFSANDAAEANTKLDNHNAELAGLKSGYIYTSGAHAQETRPDIRAQKARDTNLQMQLTALQALMNDPDYAAAYQAAHDTITEFKSRMHMRLAQLETQIQGFDEALENLKPGSAEHIRLMQEREAIQRKQQDLLDYYEEAIRPVEDRMNDPNNPLSEEELLEFEDGVRENMKGFSLSKPEQIEESAPLIQSTINNPIPQIG